VNECNSLLNQIFLRQLYVNGIPFCKQYIMIHHELDISRCVNLLDTVVVTCFYHDINDTLKYCPTLDSVCVFVCVHVGVCVCVCVCVGVCVVYIGVCVCVCVGVCGVCACTYQGVLMILIKRRLTFIHLEFCCTKL